MAIVTGRLRSKARARAQMPDQIAPESDLEQLFHGRGPANPSIPAPRSYDFPNKKLYVEPDIQGNDVKDYKKYKPDTQEN